MSIQPYWGIKVSTYGSDMHTVHAVTGSFTIEQISVVQAAMSQADPYHYLKPESVSSPHSGHGGCNIEKAPLTLLLPEFKPEQKPHEIYFSSFAK